MSFDRLGSGARALRQSRPLYLVNPGRALDISRILAFTAERVSSKSI